MRVSPKASAEAEAHAVLYLLQGKRPPHRKGWRRLRPLVATALYALALAVDSAETHDLSMRLIGNRVIDEGA